jgi:hypothetical protein
MESGKTLLSHCCLCTTSVQPADFILVAQFAAEDDSKAGVRSVVAEPSSTVCHSVRSPMDSLPAQKETQLFVDEFDRGCLSVVPESVDGEFDTLNEMVSSARSEDITPGTSVSLCTLSKFAFKNHIHTQI